ncbi:uncharacterized protein PHALS_02238 [Plasmopara halstedii]|uniref:Uncharacterized protein n=1 Tax=Plasmopara halstedii TaxID=4781 RepID=A0A0P1AXT5_PLAHL|nr:uncharacterized protein PHALS_02238 [Plasmopara halstedii]CEG45904.1 hypothetical protein PHALS_02238 [Plasmopara halstedii]|eukprot:XP_024582273.1 hypothetical protein PHALS_02238 [Plasmopara halstedii]
MSEGIDCPSPSRLELPLVRDYTLTVDDYNLAYLQIFYDQERGYGRLYQDAPY